MIYILDKKIRFNTADSSLIALSEGSGPLFLNKFCAELLELLIAHQGQPVSRDHVFETLWEQKGMMATNGGLNNYVSMLRKGLAECGCDNIIETLPRYGFVFTASAEPQSESLLVTGNITQENTPNLYVESGLNYFRKAWSVALLSMGVVFLSCVLWYVSREQQLHRIELFREGNCRYYVADDKTNIADHDELIEKIQEIVKREKIDCHSQTNAYYFSDRMLDSRGNLISDELLSVCPYDSKAPCINYSFLKSDPIDDE